MDRVSLIKELGRTFQEAEKKELGEARYNADSQTLLSDEDAERLRRIEEEQKKEARHILALEEDVYQDILLGRRSFLVLKDEGYIMGDSVLIRAYDSLRPTGEMQVKILTHVEKVSDGLKPGYCVISWE